MSLEKVDRIAIGFLFGVAVLFLACITVVIGLAIREKLEKPPPVARTIEKTGTMLKLGDRLLAIWRDDASGAEYVFTEDGVIVLQPPAPKVEP